MSEFQRKGNFVRIQEADLQARIDDAFARGKASAAATSPASPAASASLAGEDVRVAGIKALPLASTYPSLVTSMIADGMSVADASMRMLEAHAATKPGSTDSSYGPLDNMRPGGAGWEKSVAESSGKLRDYVHEQAAAGRTVSVSQAAVELESRGQL